MGKSTWEDVVLITEGDKTNGVIVLCDKDRTSYAQHVLWDYNTTGQEITVIDLAGFDLYSKPEAAAWQLFQLLRENKEDIIVIWGEWRHPNVASDRFDNVLKAAIALTEERKVTWETPGATLQFKFLGKIVCVTNDPDHLSRGVRQRSVTCDMRTKDK